MATVSKRKKLRKDDLRMVKITTSEYKELLRIRVSLQQYRDDKLRQAYYNVRRWTTPWGYANNAASYNAKSQEEFELLNGQHDTRVASCETQIPVSQHGIPLLGAPTPKGYKWQK